MRQWKAAGPAPRDVDDELWKRFRGAQDTFFGARDAANAELDAEFAANAEVKEKLLVEAEALLPVTDLEAAKKAFRDIAERWDAAGKVPRDRMKDLEGRMRKVEQAIRGVEDEQWRRTDPEKSARADDMVAKLEAAIAELEADLDKARAAGDEKKVKDLEENLASRQAFLDDGPQGRRRVLRLTAESAAESADRTWPSAQMWPGHAEPHSRRLGASRRGRSAPTRLLGDAVGVEDAGDGADGAEHAVEVLGVGHLEGEAALGDPVAGGGEGGAEDVHVRVREHHGDVGEQPGAVERLDLDVDQERRLRGRRPLDLEQPLGLATAGSAALVQSGGAPRPRRPW